MSDLRFGDDEKEVSSEDIEIRVNQLRCITKFENCQAVKQKRMNGNDEMMFGIFGEESPSTRSDVSPEVAALNARLILPNASDEYVSHIEIRNYEIPLNPLFREIFSCLDEDIKLSQKEKNEIYLHVNLKKEQQTPRSALFEAISLLLEELKLKREIKRIKTLCFPFVHFGKVRISAKVDEKNRSLKIEIFNLFGSLFGFMIVLDEDSIDCKEVLEDVFMTESILKTKFVSDNSDSEDDSENLKEPDENQNSIVPKKESTMLSLLISLLQEKMNLLKDLQDDVSTTPLPYLGIDSLRLAELEYHIMNSPDFKDCSFKAPFLIPYKTLSQIAEFLNKSKSETNGSSELKLPPMPKKSEGSKFEIPLSSQQKRILFVKELEKDQMKLLDTRMNSQFDEPILLEFSEMDQDTVTKILNYLILVHSIFRTEYKEDFQYLLSATECFVAIREKHETTERISFSSGIRCIQKSDLKLQIIFNHISIDGRSLSTFYRQFKELLRFPNSSFPKTSLQYHDYCRSEDRTSDESLRYWNQYLNVENLELGKVPTDFSSDSEFFTASYIHKSFPVRLQRKFDAICNIISVSRFELFFGLLEISIHRTLGISETFAMGYAVDQKTFPYFETIGCFTNVLLYLSRKFDSRGLLNQLKECQKSLRESRSHGDIFYENIAKLTGIKEDLFQCFVVSDVVDVEVKQSNKRRVRFEDETVNVEIIQDSDIENKVSKYPMTWYLRQFENDQLHVELEYATELFKKETVESILEEMFRIINSFVHLGKGGELDIISETFPNKRSVVSMQNSDFPTYTVSQIVNNNSSGSTVRYLQKDFKLRSSPFSSFLLKSHIQLHCQLLTEQPVILHMPRNPDLIQAVIGCWHAGFYPVPLHKDAQEKQIKTTCQGLGLKLEDTMILRSLEDFRTKKLNSDKWRVFNRSSLFDLAYVTSTSGSTGIPKLVGTAFEGHSNLARQYTTSFHISSRDTIGQVVDPSFDIFFADIVKTLTNGARLLLSRDSIATSSELLECTNVYLMPAFLTRMPDMKSLENLETLQYGGEPLAPQVLELIHKNNERLKVYQEFGLTEQTVYSSRKRILRGNHDSEEMRVIGEPYDNIQFEVKSFCEPSESVMRGQLVLKGVGLMRGYFGVTKEYLKELPTGDEVMRRKNGDIIFIGRKDSQIKIRGHRVDLFEIECIALSSKLIEICTCIAVNDNKQLVLFFKLKSARNTEDSEFSIRNYLEKNLISYKVPNYLQRLDSFPLTRTGKVDKKKLEVIFKERGNKAEELDNRKSTVNLGERQESCKRKDSTTSSLLKWLQQYSNSKIDSIDVDIFKSGVDSIAVMLAMQKLRSEGVDIPVKLFFKEKTIRRIVNSALVNSNEFDRNVGGNKEEKEKVVSNHLLTPPDHFVNLNHIQKRILFLSRMTTASFDPFRLQFSISIPSNKLKNLYQAVNYVVIGNQMLRSKLQRIRGEYRFNLLSGTECYRNLESCVSDNSKKDPFIMEIWLNQSKLFISIHHIICDGRSLKILREQIKTVLENGSMEFQNNFIDSSHHINEISARIFDGLENWTPLFTSFKIGSKSSKLRFSVSLKHIEESVPTKFQMGFFYFKSICSVFNISSPFPIATTFANRTNENWNTVSMFANTLPLMCTPGETLESFTEKFYELTENSNIPLNEILKNKSSRDGNFADFALNFHEHLDQNNDELEDLCQFPIVLTFSEADEMAQIEFDSAVLPAELAEKVMNTIMKECGCVGNVKRDDNKFDYVEVFQKFLKNSNVTEETDFFLAGGHSLIAMQLIDYLSDLWEMEIPLKLIFEFRTPKMLEFAVNKLREGEVPVPVTTESKKEEKFEVLFTKSNQTQMSAVNSKPTSREYKYPLSSQQNQMFYLSQFTENSLEYQLPFIQPFPSTVTPLKIHQSLLMTIQEQNIFRTVFRMDSETGEPFQMVISMTEAFISCHVEVVNNEETLHKRIRDLCEEPIDVLSGRPLLKASFISSPTKQVAFLHLHHLISDARSTQLTNATMKSFFENTDKRPHRPKFTYMNYCCLGNEHHVKMDSEYLKTLIDGLEGWKFLETKTKVTEKVFIDLSRELISKELIGSGDTPFSIFLKLISSSLKICFSKLTDFNIAFPVLNRNEKTANICGYFLNNLIINSSQLESLPSIISANYPYSNVIQEVRRISEKDESVAEVYINCRYDLEFDESDDDVLLDLVPLKLHFPIEFDVDLFANETYRVTMRSNKFTKEEMTKILMQLENQLGETRKQISDSVKNTGILYGVRKDVPKSSIPELYQNFFNSNFACTFAISNSKLPWSYHQIYQKFLKYSWKLRRDYLASRASPIRSDDIIGIIGRKSVETTVRCLAVQFTGVAYLPVDEEYPEKRKKEILRDVQFVFQDFKEGEELIALPRRHFSISTPYCLSYIITTSGTTGRPKSVAIGADSLSNLCLSSTLTMRASNSSRIFQFTKFVFDNSVLEVLMAIASQATLIYGSSSFDPSDFEKSLETPGITHCLLFPSLVQSFDISKIKNLSYWIVGGERLPQNLLDSALKLGVCVIQNYGPTETTAFAIAKQMKEGDAGCHIGYPAFNSKVKIDDSGELLISGSGIMRGYLNRDDYFKYVDGRLWYPSGDICNVFNKSEVEFLGRTDSQVKVRGFRVELSEIETIVESHDEVINCKTIFESESQQIHLFYTGKATALELRQFCEKLLEPQKIPSTFNGIHKFPLTQNSKIDKVKLMEVLKNLTKPSTSAETFGIESELSSIWITLLNCPKPFHSDHFFLIGGHSLLLIRLRHLIQTKLDIQLSVPEILENLKFGEMLKLLQKKKRATNGRVMIFFPALYGGCTAYLKLISTMKNRNESLKIVLLEEESGETVEEVTGKYKKQIEEKLTDQKRPLVFVGASSAGTFAYATAQQFNECFRISVILLDSGTFWNLIEQLSFSKHEQEMIRNLKNYEVDQKTAEDLAASSWNTLQILKNYQPELLHRNAQVHILSVDGTDLGWSKYSGKLEVHKISGDHYSMLQENDNVLEIEQILTKILEEF